MEDHGQAAHIAPDQIASSANRTTSTLVANQNYIRRAPIATIVPPSGPCVWIAGANGPRQLGLILTLSEPSWREHGRACKFAPDLTSAREVGAKENCHLRARRQPLQRGLRLSQLPRHANAADLALPRCDVSALDRPPVWTNNIRHQCPWLQRVVHARSLIFFVCLQAIIELLRVCSFISWTC